jgi:hypothetical protein
VKYELKSPEGSLLQPAQLEEIAAFAKAQGFSNEQAQVLVERESNAIASYVKANDVGGAMWQARVDGWKNEVLADKELGGTPEVLATTVAHGERALDHFFDKSVREYLDTSGLGSHPAVLRGFAKIGKLMQNDKIVVPNAQSGAGKKSPAEMLYGETKQ